MLLVIDNYDSFVHNLARYMALAGWDYKVARNDEIALQEIEDLKPEAILLSPGPCTPAKAGISIEIIKRFGPSVPVLGVCLGHQCIGEAYDAQTVRAERPIHGKTSQVHHDGGGIFAGLPNPISAGRYHSLIVAPDENSPLIVTARTAEGEIMAVRHKEYPVYGVQFHPESILTPHGMDLLKNFTSIALGWNARRREAA